MTQPGQSTLQAELTVPHERRMDPSLPASQHAPKTIGVTCQCISALLCSMEEQSCLQGHGHGHGHGLLRVFETAWGLLALEGPLDSHLPPGPSLDPSARYTPMLSV